MGILRHINKMKFGVIDQDYMNQLAQSTGEFDDIKAEIKQVLSQDVRRGSKSFLAQIGYSGDIAWYPEESPHLFPIAWRYNWTRVDLKDPHFFNNSMDLVTEELYEDPQTGQNFNDTGGCQDAVGSPLGAFGCFAYNIAELSNILTVPIVFGVDVAGASYPDGFSPQPLPPSSLVWLTKISSPYLGSTNYYFDRQGTHDGVCESP
tara:strand:+ start:2005 stop:2619 length:615 start_codon:yes stop_codon:yes gene_type:complete